MDPIAEIKAEHLATADKRWEDAVQAYRETLNHYRPAVGKLAHRMLTVRRMTMFYAFGGAQTGAAFEMHSYVNSMPHSPCSRLEFASNFAGYLIGKHCEPGIAYYRYATEDSDPGGESYMLCSKDHPDAMPYFHCSNEQQQCEDPSHAERATAERALEILDWYEDREAEYKRNMLDEIEEEGDVCMWDADDVAATEFSEDEKRMVALADTIAAMKD